MKTQLKIRVSVLAVASCLSGLPLMADAAGLGRITVFSALGQPLRAEIEVNANKDEVPGMAAKIASPEAFRQAGLEYAGALSSVKVVLDKRPNGQPYLKLTSERPVSDPFVDMLLELNWTAGRLVREYTFLLDPPEAGRSAPASTPAPAAAPRAVEKVAEKAPEPAAEKAVEKTAEKPVAEKAPEKAGKKSGKSQEKKVAAAEKSTEKAAESSAGRQVKSGDTLAKIAKEVKPEGIALEQMLVGLFRANPDAFQGNNMNRLKSGVILSVPAKSEVESVGAPEARKEVVAQAQDWSAYRSKLAGVTAQAPAAEKPAQKETAGKITAKVEDKTAKPVESKDQLKVSKTQVTGTQPPAVKKSSAEEEKIAREKALKESAERAAQLEKNVADLQKLADMKNKQLAQAQAAAKPAEPPKAAEPAKPATPPAPPAPEPAKAAAPAAPAVPAAPAPTDAKPVEPPKADAAKPAEESAKPTEAPKPDAAKPADAPKPKPKAPPPPPVEEEDDGMGLGLIGGLLALLGGVGGLFYYRRKKALSGEKPVVGPSLGEPSLGANSVFRATGGQSIDTSAATPAVTDFSQTGPGTIDTDEVDPVAEAEVYMAYGRDAQAEEILLEALQKDGKRLAIHLKLLEIYAQRKSAKQFETLATELYAQTGGNGPEWEKAVAMGSKLDPANPLYSGDSSSAPAASPFGAAAAMSSFDADATAVLSAADMQSVSAPEATPIAEAPAFDLNIGDDPFAAPPVEAFSPGDTVIKSEPEVAEPAPAADSFALDFDLDLGGGAPSTPAANPVAAEASALPDLDLGGGLDFDLQLGESNVAPTIQEPANKPDLSSISLDLGEPDKGADVDSGVMNFESTMLAPPGMSDGMATNIIGGMGMSAGGADVETGNAQEQAVATKLDLAKAYEEMGDAEGARELLQEVMAEGSPSQKDAATAMLARLG